MKITAKMVKELRTMTGAGMMNCKNALIEAEGDMDLANDILRKKGLKLVDKKSNRDTNEGLVGVLVVDNSVSVVEVNCETDFVSRNEQFQDFVMNTARAVINDPGEPIDMTELVTTLGENIKVGHFSLIDANNNETISTYVHGSIGENIGTIGVAVIHDGDDELGKKLAMHIAASNPKAVNVDQLDPEWIENEKRLLTEQAIESGKPENIVEKMVIGRMNKILREVSLMDQPFVMDTDKTIGTLLEEHGVEVFDFIRIEVGE